MFWNDSTNYTTINSFKQNNWIKNHLSYFRSIVSIWNYELNIDLYEWKTCWNWYVSDPDQMKHEYCATYPHFQSKQFINVWLLNRTNVKKRRVNCRKTKKGSDRYLLGWKVQFKGQLFFWCLVQKFQEKRLILISLYNGSN